jgi:Fic family protein
MATYIYQIKGWPEFTFDSQRLSKTLSAVRHKQGRFIGRMESLGFHLREEAVLQMLTIDILKSNEIEGEILNPDQVRSSIARRLGMDIAGLIPSDRNVEGVVEMMLNATQKFNEPLTGERLSDWHASLFPTGRSGIHKITVGNWRSGPMQVVSGPMGRERIHYEAPEGAALAKEIQQFIDWFNDEQNLDAVLMAAIAHLWFVTIHPFDDGNGRIARAIADLQLSRADGTSQRFYSMSAQIQKERKAYYDILEATQKGGLDITHWLAWFLNCLDRALDATEETLATVIRKSKFWGKNSGANFNARQKLMLNKLLDGFEGKLNSSKWGKIAQCSTDTALRDIQELIGLGILQKEDAGGRSTSYVLNGGN